MTQEEILAFLTRKRTQEELREYVNPDGKLNYFGTQKILNDYCNRWKLNECESYLYVCRHFFRKNFLSGKNSSILEIEQKKLKKGDFVNGKIVDGRIGRTKRKRIR